MNSSRVGACKLVQTGANRYKVMQPGASGQIGQTCPAKDALSGQGTPGRPYGRPTVGLHYSDVIRCIYFSGASARRGRLKVLRERRQVLEPGKLLAFPAAVLRTVVQPLLSQSPKGFQPSNGFFVVAKAPAAMQLPAGPGVRPGKEFCEKSKTSPGRRQDTWVFKTVGGGRAAGRGPGPGRGAGV
jgi:hypothetical protein